MWSGRGQEERFRLYTHQDNPCWNTGACFASAPVPCPYLSEGEGELIQDCALVEELATVPVVVVLMHALPHVLGQIVVPHVLVHLVQLDGRGKRHRREATEVLT